MESMGVISRVDQPTLRCPGMVIVPKKSSNIRNKSVLRGVHPLPKVDKTLAQLIRTKVFSGQ